MQLLNHESTYDNCVGSEFHSYTDVNMIQNEESEERFERYEKLGEGTYGVVFRVRDRQTNEIAAQKMIRLHNTDEGIPATTLREISLL